MALRNRQSDYDANRTSSTFQKSSKCSRKRIYFFDSHITFVVAVVSVGGGFPFRILDGIRIWLESVSIPESITLAYRNDQIQLKSKVESLSSFLSVTLFAIICRNVYVCGCGLGDYLVR